MVAWLVTARISPSPPRGMTTSMYSSSLSISATASRSVVGGTWTASRGSPASSRARCISPARNLLEWNASLPPRRMTALPALRQRMPASTVALGRDS